MQIIIEHYPKRQIPERHFETIDVPGRDGSIIIPTGSFKNYRETYQVFIDAIEPDDETYQLVTRGLAQWLLYDGYPADKVQTAYKYYNRFEDTYDLDFYRMAYYSGGSNFSNFFNIYGRGDIEFTFAPRRFYKKGDKPIVITSPSVINNPSIFLADPLYKIFPSTVSPVLTVNGSTMSFSLESITDSIVVDTQCHTTRLASSPLVRVDVTSGNYEDLRLGKENMVGFNNASSVEIIPRWWTL